MLGSMSLLTVSSFMVLIFRRTLLIRELLALYSVLPLQVAREIDLRLTERRYNATRRRFKLLLQ